VVETDYNTEAAQQYCPRVVKIVGPIDTTRYHPALTISEATPLVIGWIGSPDTAGYLSAVYDVLSDLARTHPLVLRTIGSGPLDISDVPVETFDWSLEDEVSLLQSFHIGIGPLPDNDWTRGKAGYKLLQYMAVGIPVVASPVGEHGRIVVNESTGFHATSDPEWRRSLATLIENPDLRVAMGRAGRARAEQVYSFEAATETLLAEFVSLTSAPSRHQLN
jgi:glycosyltransferase involved in cell wall biosynthesis